MYSCKSCDSYRGAETFCNNINTHKTRINKLTLQFLKISDLRVIVGLVAFQLDILCFFSCYLFHISQKVCFLRLLIIDRMFRLKQNKMFVIKLLYNRFTLKVLPTRVGKNSDRIKPGFAVRCAYTTYRKRREH